MLAELEADRHVGRERRHPLPGVRKGIQQDEQGAFVVPDPGQFDRGGILLEPMRGQGLGGQAAEGFGWLGHKWLWDADTPWVHARSWGWA